MALEVPLSGLRRGVTVPRWGYCHVNILGSSRAAEEAVNLGFCPTAGSVLNAQPDEEWGPWNMRLPGWCEQVSTTLDSAQMETRIVDVILGQKVVGGHTTTNPNEGCTLWEWIAKHGYDLFIGYSLSDLVDKGQDLTEEARDFTLSVLDSTSAFNADAAENYARLGDRMEEVHKRGGFANMTRSMLSNIVQQLVSRWATAREATAAARLATSLIFNKEEEPWSPQIFEDAMEIDEGEEQKQARLLSMAGMVFKTSVGGRLEEWQRRRVFRAWKADATAPAKAFCRAVGVDDSAVDAALARAIKSSVPLMSWAATTLKASAIPAVKVMATVAAGGAVSAALFAAAGLALDWYYTDLQQQKLGPDRESSDDGIIPFNSVGRATEYFTIGAAVSDEVYDCATHTQVVRIDPFFFSVKNDFSKLKDDTAAQRMLANSVIPPLIQNVTTTNKTVILLPGTVSDESARHMQEAMPEFYFRIVNRSHSHPELWAVRRGFEMIVARQINSADKFRSVVTIGANVRQVCKIPNVVANYGPELTGRDNARHQTKGTQQQRAFFNNVNIPEKFGARPRLFKNAVGAAFYMQDMSKEAYLQAAIASGIRKHFVALNIPVIMMDHRITEWEDHVLCVRYRKDGDRLYMTPLTMPVAGYCNPFSATMSWVKPHKPFIGYDVTISAIAQVGSSYLLEIDIGTGPQEAYDTIWRMPDAGHYVLHDLTRESDEYSYYTVPAAKFDQVVKFVVQLTGAKNVVEATAGRILGLEAQIKIGGTVLERAWLQSHRQFTSTMIHAMISAGLDKSDALFMASKLRSHFDEVKTRSLMERILNGWTKLLGWQTDDRKPGKAKRGASDYDVVTHWTSHQGSGFGAAAPFDESSNEDSDDTKRAKSTPVPDKTAKPAKKVKKSPPKKDAENEDAIVDEGHVTREELDDDDRDSETSEIAPDETLIDKMTKWFGTSSEPIKTPDGCVGEIKPDSFCQRLIIPQHEIASLVTTSSFDPTGVPAYGTSGGSMQDSNFKSNHASDADVEATLRAKKSMAMPDTGGAHIVRLALNIDAHDSTAPSTLMRPVANAVDDTPYGKLEAEFFSEVGDEDAVRVPNLLIDGIAGAAKSSIAKTFVHENRVSAAIVCPTRALAKAWKKDKVGTVVTKHKLKLSTLRGRAVLIIDEIYALTKQELYGLLWKARRANVKVLALGDRRQQYEDGGELTHTDLEFLGIPCVRMCVSNTMPADALYIAKWAGSGDPHLDWFQTRNQRVHSIWFRQKDQPDDLERLLKLTKSSDVLTFKDRLQMPLDLTGVTDEELGFKTGDEDNWLSVSRTQGLRSKNSLLMSGRLTTMEKWFASQPGLFYVAVSRHSVSMEVHCDQYDLNLLKGLSFESVVTVQGRLAVLQLREQFASPTFILQASAVKDSRILSQLAKRGFGPQSLRFKTMGPIREDWRPWHKFASMDSQVAKSVFNATTQRLVGQEMPYVETEAVKYPVYQEAMGLHSLRRPNLWAGEKLNAAFGGLSRLAVLQNSKDEVLDQKNVIERTARPRQIDEDPMRVRIQAQTLYEKFKEAYFAEDGEKHLSTFPSPEEWASSRTSDFTSALENSDFYGMTAFSTRSQGFLKTQTKVKLKRNFALEENYGQTVLASPKDFNTLFGPWSKMAMRNARLLVRPGVVMDSGFSDKELARHFRTHGVMPRFEDENYQADVKRQDTSHTPVTLAVFGLFLKDLGIPEELVDLYVKHSATFEYASMKSGLYRGTARYNLGSGDPFTLFRNIAEVMTVMIERYGVAQIKSSNMVIKGDDFLGDKIMMLLPPTVPEIRATQLTEDFDKPPYHAGRFFLPDDVIPDPVRMVSKILVKRSDSIDRVNELAHSFYDRYIALTDYSYSKMQKYVVEAYSEFEPELPLSALDMYHALRDRSLFYELLADSDVSDDTKLAVVDAATDCAAAAVSWFSKDPRLLELVRNEDRASIECILTRNLIPVYHVRGKPNDFMKRGVWLTEDHAWAVVGLTEFKEAEERESERSDESPNEQ